VSLLKKKIKQAKDCITHIALQVPIYMYTVTAVNYEFIDTLLRL